jgi:hypothetical protein
VKISSRKIDEFTAQLVESLDESAAAQAIGHTLAQLVGAAEEPGNEEFKHRWRQARRAAERIAAFRRAVTGVLVPKYHEGSVVGHVREYDSGLLKLMLAAQSEFAPKSTVTHRGTTKKIVEVTTPKLTAESTAAIVADALKRLAEREGAVDAEYAEVPAITDQRDDNDQDEESRRLAVEFEQLK